MRELGNSSPSRPLPDGIVREASPPERLVVLWASRDQADLLDRLHAAGHLPVVLSPQETQEMVDISGAPAMLLVEAGLLGPESVRVLQWLRAQSRNMRICVLAGPTADSAGLLTALRLGLSEVVDPADAAELGRLLVPPENGRPGERVLAVGAHPDDVEIGCGATLLRHRSSGHPVTVLTLSRGASGGHRETRRREAVGAAVAMSAELLMGDLPDTRMEHAHEMIELIEGVIAVVEPTTVYVHSQSDNHQDHRAVHEATVIAARRVAQLFCYQSPSSHNGFAPTRFVPVEETVHAKVEVLSSYRSQATRHYLEPDLILASARYWARQLPHTRYAEPFEVLRASDQGSA